MARFAVGGNTPAVCSGASLLHGRFGRPVGLHPAALTSRLELMRREEAESAATLTALLDGGGAFPDWSSEDLAALVPDASLRDPLVQSLRPRGRDFFTEPVPVAPDWPDAPCGYLQLSESYDSAARLARMRGWPVLDGGSGSMEGGVRPGGHFAALVDPGRLAVDLEELLRQL